MYMLTPSDNPAKDDQALARVIRRGQKRKVFCYRIVMLGSPQVATLQRQLVKVASWEFYVGRDVSELLGLPRWRPSGS